MRIAKTKINNNRRIVFLYLLIECFLIMSLTVYNSPFQTLPEILRQLFDLTEIYILFIVAGCFLCLIENKAISLLSIAIQCIFIAICSFGTKNIAYAIFVWGIFSFLFCWILEYHRLKQYTLKWTKICIIPAITVLSSCLWMTLYAALVWGLWDSINPEVRIKGGMAILMLVAIALYALTLIICIYYVLAYPCKPIFFLFGAVPFSFAYFIGFSPFPILYFIFYPTSLFVGVLAIWFSTTRMREYIQTKTYFTE